MRSWMNRWLPLWILVIALGAAQADAQLTPAQVLPGEWEAAIPSPYGTMTVHIVLLQDHTFNKTARWSDKMTYEWGRWWIGEGFLRLEYAGHRPEEYGGIRLSYPDAESVFFQIIDANHLSCEDRVLGTRWDVHRVGS